MLVKPLEVVAHESLALTKMDGNNDALYIPVPVSIRYSQKLARTIANLSDLPGKTYSYWLFTSDRWSHVGTLLVPRCFMGAYVGGKQ